MRSRIDATIVRKDIVVAVSSQRRLHRNLPRCEVDRNRRGNKGEPAATNSMSSKKLDIINSPRFFINSIGVSCLSVATRR